MCVILSVTGWKWKYTSSSSSMRSLKEWILAWHAKSGAWNKKGKKPKQETHIFGIWSVNVFVMWIIIYIQKKKGRKKYIYVGFQNGAFLPMMNSVLSSIISQLVHDDGNLMWHMAVACAMPCTIPSALSVRLYTYKNVCIVEDSRTRRLMYFIPVHCNWRCSMRFWTMPLGI